MTIKDIAKECGCAIGTVSRVLNNHPDVSDKTREKVMAVVQKYGFVLNANALSETRNCSLGILCNEHRFARSRHRNGDYF